MCNTLRLLIPFMRRDGHNSEKTEVNYKQESTTTTTTTILPPPSPLLLLLLL
jgi:hypothetical protein